MKITRNRPSGFLPNQTFNLLTSVCFVRYESGEARIAYWKFNCACGNSVVRCYSAVKNGKATNCGCLAKANRRKAHVKHGYRHTRFYRCWQGMWSRATNPKHLAYKRYKTLGINICPKWEKFTGFLEDMLEGYSDELTLERINNNKGYYKDNCKWATRKEQNRNTRVTLKVRYRGKLWKLCELTESLGLSYARVWGRLNKCKWSLERALHEPIQEHKNRYRKKVVYFTRVVEG